MEITRNDYIYIYTIFSQPSMLNYVTVFGAEFVWQSVAENKLIKT